MKPHPRYLGCGFSDRSVASENAPFYDGKLHKLSETEILKSRINAGLEPDMFYYRDIDQREIDLLIEDGQSLYPVEIKKAKNPAVKQRNLKVLEKSKKEVGPAIILCMTEELVPMNNDIWLCPVGAI